MTAKHNYALQAVHSILKQKKKQATTSNIQKTILKTLIDLDATKKHNDALPFIELLVDPLDSNLRDDYLKITIKYLQMNKHKSNLLNIISENFAKVSMDEFLFICQANIKELQFIIKNNFETYYHKVPVDYRHFLLGFICDNMTFVESFDLSTFLEYLYDRKAAKAGKINTQYCKFLWLYLNYLTKRENVFEKFTKFITIFEEVKANNTFNIYLLKILAKLLQIKYYQNNKKDNMEFELSESIVNSISDNIVVNDETLSFYKDIILFGHSYNQTAIESFVVTLLRTYKGTKTDLSHHLLTCYANNFGLARFCELIVKNDYELGLYFDIFKSSTNVDLSILIQLFGDLKNTDDIYSLFSTFTKFCTDKNNTFTDIAKILLKETKKGNIKTLKPIAQGIINIISTYLRAKENKIVLHNNITAEETNKIFSIIIDCDFLNVFYNAYTNHEDPIFQEAVQTILQIQSIDENTTEAIQKVIRSIKEDETVDLTQTKYLNNCKDVVSVLKVAKLFIPKFTESATFTAKILNLLKTKNNVQQKNAYSFLHDMAIYNKLGICICDTIVAEDYSEYYTCSIRYRLLTLFALYNHCTKCNKANEAFTSKIIFELILNAKSNSAKARKISEDILDANVNDTNYKVFIKNIITGFNTDNYKIINGAIKCLIFFMTNKKEYINKNIDMIIAQAKKLQHKGKEVQKSVIELYKTMIIELDCINSDEYLGYISGFANSRRKVDNAIKRAGKELQGRTRLTKAVDNIIHKKFKGQNNLNLKVSKKGVVELGYKITFDSDSE